MNGIFIESNENLGLLYNRYKDIPDTTDKFLNDIENAVPGSDISDKLDDFKRVVKGMMKTPEPVNPKTIKRERQLVKVVRDKTEKLITKLKNIYEKYQAIKTDENKSSSSIESAIECVRKVIVDILNLCDQDINLLSLVDTVYYRKVYESDCSTMLNDNDDIEDIMESSVDDIVSDLYEEACISYMESNDDKSSDDNKHEQTKANINNVTDEIKDSDEKYYPIFPMSVAYNYGPAYTFMAPIIHNITNGDEYTHSFMSFDPEFKTIMTFGGKGLEYMTVEDYQAFKYSKSVYISVVWLTKDEINDIKRTIKEYVDNPKDVRFSLFNFFTMMLGKIKRKDKSHCCSAFLGYLLNVANKKNLTKDYSQTRPEDITLLPRAFYVGTFKDLDDLNKKRGELKKRIKKLYDDNIDDIREYNNIIPRVMLTDNIKKPRELKKFFKRMVTN